MDNNSGVWNMTEERLATVIAGQHWLCPTCNVVGFDTNNCSSSHKAPVLVEPQTRNEYELGLAKRVQLFKP
jgi:hypothetical protein